MLSAAPLVDNSVGIWFMKDDPDLKIYEDFNQQFGQKEWASLLLQTGLDIRPAVPARSRADHRAYRKVDHVTKVVSLTNVRDSAAAGDGGLTYRRLYPADDAGRPAQRRPGRRIPGHGSTRIRFSSTAS